MANDDPMRYCADRCVSTGNCDVFEDMFDLGEFDAAICFMQLPSLLKNELYWFVTISLNYYNRPHASYDVLQRMCAVRG